MSLVENEILEVKKKQTILIVDDDKSNIDILLHILSDYDIITTLEGQKAIEIALADNIDLILLDIVMPNMDGFEVCQMLKISDKSSNIPIIFLSAKYDMDDITKGFELGAVDYITKPFNPIELKCRVKTHIELQMYKKDLEKKNIELQKLNQKIKDVIKKDMEEIYLGNQYISGEDVNLSSFDHYLDSISLDDE